MRSRIFGSGSFLSRLKNRINKSMEEAGKRIVLLIIDASVDGTDAMMHMQKGNEAAHEDDKKE